MTISTTDSRKNYTGNGSTVAFSFPYKFLADADLYVYVDDVLQTLTTDYTVSGAGSDSGGTVTFVTAPASATRVTLVRATPLTQEVDYISGDSFPAETHESALDKNVMGLQDARESFLNRTVMLATSAEGSLTPISDTIAQRASKYISFNALGDIVLSTGTTSTIVHGTTGESLAGTQTPSAALTVLGLTATASELNIMDGVTATASELNIMDGVTATTAELNIMDGVTSTAAELNLLDGKSFLDEDTMSSDSATALASQQSIKAYVDTGIPRVSARVKMNTSNLVYQTLYSKSVATDFGVSSGTILNVFFELECKTAHDGFTVGNIVSMYGMNNGYADSHQNPAHWSSSDCATATVYTATNDAGSGVLHLWTKTVGSITADTWLDYDKWDIYARVYYTI